MSKLNTAGMKFKFNSIDSFHYTILPLY